MLGLYWKRRQQQIALPGFDDKPFDNSHQTTWLIGDFYESLTAKQLDAEIYQDKMRAHEKGALVPDLASWDWDLLYESKAASLAYKFVVKWNQIDSYDHFSKQEFPWDNPQVYYIWFAHGLTGILDNHGSELKLINGLAKNTAYMVITPLEIVQHMRELYPYETAYHGKMPFFRIPHKMILNFQLNPKRAFKLLELNRQDYSCVNLWSKPCRALRWGVNTFPITLVWKKGTTPPHLAKRKGRKDNGRTYFIV